MSSPATPSSPGAPSAAGATDPGFDAVESLYRGASGRSGLRAYEPSLRPPEGTHDYSWLYRTHEPTGPAPDHAATDPGLVSTGSGVALAVAPAPLVNWSPSVLSPARRWRSVALLALALSCALLLPWAAGTL